MFYHFSGIAGAGMNPLARLMAAWGHQVQGSDRSFDQGRNGDIAERLRAAGISLLPQDGTAVTSRVERFIYSAAVEADTPEMSAARALAIPMLARPALLAEVVNQGAPGVAIAGTSGKSSVTALVAWILRHAGREHTLLGGAALVGEGTAGGFQAGPAGGMLIAEACESDGTLVGYRPTIGVVHNITRDHSELAPLRTQFATFAAQCQTLLVNADCAEANALVATNRFSYGAEAACDAPYEILATGPTRALGVLRLPDGSEVDLDCPQPGRHSVQNAAAAACVARLLGVDVPAIAAGIRTYPGISRRFEVLGTSDTRIRVVDDYAHNADKIRAAITAAQAGCERLVAAFLPHGFGPARFLRDELRALLPGILRPGDRFAYGPIFYAGGSVAQDISSHDLANDIGCHAAADKDGLVAWYCDTAAPGDTVLLMGARDPDLGNLARRLYALL